MRRRRGGIYLACAVAHLTIVWPVRAQDTQGQDPPGVSLPPPEAATVPAPRFGDAGQLALSSGLGLDISHLNRTDSDATSFSVNVRPGADVFLWRNVSVGGLLLFGYRANSTPYFFPSSSLEPNAARSITLDSSTITYGIAGRIGFNAPMGEWVSFWPRLSFGVWTESTTQPALPPSLVL